MYGNVLRITPPMNVGSADVDQFIELLDTSLAACSAMAAGSVQSERPPFRESGAVSGSASGVRFAVGAGGGQPLPVLLRCAMHGGLPHAHRCAALHQEDRHRQPARVGADDSGCQHPGAELLARMSGGRAVRGRLRDAPRTTRSRSKSGGCSGTRWTIFMREPRTLPAAPAACDRGARSRASAAARRRWPARRNCGGTAYAVTIFDNRPLPGRAEHLRRRGVQAAAVGQPAGSGAGAVDGRGVPAGGGRARRSRSEDLEREFDFIFIGVGLGAMERLGIPGEDLPGVIDALRFIERYKTLPDFQVGRRGDRDRRRQYRDRRGQCGGAAGRGGGPSFLPAHREGDAGVLRSSTTTRRWKACSSTGWRSRWRSSERDGRAAAVKFVRDAVGRARCKRTPQAGADCGHGIRRSSATW